MYVCGNCIEEHSLEISWITHVCACEICGYVKNKWDTFNFCAWETELVRHFGDADLKYPPIADQLIVRSIAIFLHAKPQHIVPQHLATIRS